jgi:hypothetical protein
VAVWSDGSITCYRHSPFLLTSNSDASSTLPEVAWEASRLTCCCSIAPEHRVSTAVVTVDWGCRMHVMCAVVPKLSPVAHDNLVDSVDGPFSGDPSSALHHSTLKGSPFLVSGSPAAICCTHCSHTTLPSSHRVVQILPVRSLHGACMLAVIDATSDPSAVSTGGWEIAAFNVSGPPLPDKSTLDCMHVTPVLALVASTGAVPLEAGSRVLHAIARPQPASENIALLVEVLCRDQTCVQCVLGLEIKEAQGREQQLKVCLARRALVLPVLGDDVE